MAKMPFFQFYPNDWIRDTRHLSAQARGVWIDLLCWAWNSPERGKIEMGLEGIARLVGLPVEDTKNVLDELASGNVLDLSGVCPGKLTIVSRRMIREELQRERERERKAKERLSGVCPENVQKCPPDISEFRSQKSEVRKENTVPWAGVSAVGFSEKIQEIAFRVLGMIQPATLSEWIVDYGEDWTRDAILTAEQAGKKRSQYVTGILRRWKAEGRDVAPKGEAKKIDPVRAALKKIEDRENGHEKG